MPGGCNPTACSEAYPWRCSWQGPDLLRGMMTYHRTRKRGGGYNECIVRASARCADTPSPLDRCVALWGVSRRHHVDCVSMPHGRESNRTCWCARARRWTVQIGRYLR